MDTGQIDIHALRPTGVARVLEKLEQRLPYKSWDDKQAKRLISLNSLYQVTKQCNMTTDPDKIYVDQEGYGTLNGLQSNKETHSIMTKKAGNAKGSCRYQIRGILD